MKILKEKINNYYTDKKLVDEIYKSIDIATSISNNDKILNINFSYGLIEVLLNVIVDYKTIIGAIYYPLVKQDIINESNYEEFFDKEAWDILSTLIKVENLKINTRETQTQNIKNMFIALAKDIRVVILKLAIEQQKTKIIDLYNKEQQIEIMNEISDIFAPLASMIGIGYIKTSLENEAFKYFKPIEYAQLNKQLHEYFEERNLQINTSIERIKKEILPINATVYGRQKQISSIYKKLSTKAHDLSQIYDILAVRIIVDTIEDCYAAIGKVHAMYTPLTGRFKDYIAQPKENGYQSLHTSVVVENGDALEIQIRTKDMHTYAEYGFAAHYAYKENRRVNDSDKKINYIRSVMEMYKDKSAQELLDALKIDVYSGNIFVQSPMGKVLQFPDGATPIDFAYAIHSKVGDTCVGAKINNRMVPLSTQLKNGDIVEIITNPNSKGPSRDWLKIAKSSETKNKINSFFKKEMKDENIKRGKAILEAGAKAKTLILSRLLKDEYLEEVFDKYSFQNINDMYASLGYGGVTANQILSKLVNLNNEFEKIAKNDVTDINQLISNNQNVTSKIQNSVNVHGFNNLMTKFAKCCNPLPGDDIVGYVSRGKGVTIHRQDCESLYFSEGERLISCSWNNTNQQFVGAITIEVINKSNSLALISRKFSDLKINILSIKSALVSNDQAIISVTLNVKKKEELEDVINKLKSLNVVIDVYRTK